MGLLNSASCIFPTSVQKSDLGRKETPPEVSELVWRGFLEVADVRLRVIGNGLTTEAE